MKTFYLSFLSVGRRMGKITASLFASVAFLLSSSYAQCPTPTITAPDVCAGQQVQLVLGVGGPLPNTNFYAPVINGVTYSVQPGVPFAAQSEEDNFFGTTIPPAFGDGTPNELGVRFRPTVNGFIKGVRFYRIAVATGPFTGSLWSNTGTLLATGSFTVSPSGWQELIFAAPVAVTAGVPYVASYYTPNGFYNFTAGGLSTSITSGAGYLVTPPNGIDSLNGVFKPGLGGGFPDQSFGGGNYFVDVIFQPETVPTLFEMTSITGPGGCSASGTPLASATVTINELPSGTIASAGTVIAGSPATINFIPGDGATPYSLLINGTPSTGVTGLTSFNAGPSIPLLSDTRIWSSPTLPAPVNRNDAGTPIEVGMKFTTAVGGDITALRFYKGIATTAPTVLNLYSAAGTLLATTTHVDPTGTVTGYIEVPLGAPYTITFGTVYVVTYYSANGNYVSVNGFLNSAAYENHPLTVPATGSVPGGNGVYIYGVGGGFPINTFDGANYFADVVLNHRTTRWPLTLTQITDDNGCTVSASQSIVLNVNNPLPVSLTDFTASVIQSKNVQLDWTTASESNNKGFDVERSADASKWLTVGYVAGSGNSSTYKNYSYTDRNVPTGKYFYRLKQVDFDGKFNYSNILSVDINGSLTFELNQSFPNPSRGSSTITYSIPVKTQVVLAVYDMQGRVISVLQNGERAAGKYAVTVPANLLKPGVYYYKLEAGDFKSTRKMIIQ